MFQRNKYHPEDLFLDTCNLCISSGKNGISSGKVIFKYKLNLACLSMHTDWLSNTNLLLVPHFVFVWGVKNNILLSKEIFRSFALGLFAPFSFMRNINSAAILLIHLFKCLPYLLEIVLDLVHPPPPHLLHGGDGHHWSLIDTV